MRPRRRQNHVRPRARAEWETRGRTTNERAGGRGRTRAQCMRRPRPPTTGDGSTSPSRAIRRMRSASAGRAVRSGGPAAPRRADFNTRVSQHSDGGHRPSAHAVARRTRATNHDESSARRRCPHLRASRKDRTNRKTSHSPVVVAESPHHTTPRAADGPRRTRRASGPPPPRSRLEARAARVPPPRRTTIRRRRRRRASRAGGTCHCSPTSLWSLVLRVVRHLC